MTVTVITPIYNESPERIQATVASVRLALHANKGGEMVIIDDGSTTIVHLYPGVRLQRIEHGGISKALNTGVMLASCEYVSWVSAGDTITTDKLLAQREWMQTIGALASYHDHENSQGVFHAGKPGRLRIDNQFSLGTMMVHRAVFESYGCWFDEDLAYCQDWDFACQVQFEGPGWHHMPEVMMYDDDEGSRHTKGGGKRRTQDRVTVSRRWRA